MLERWNVGLNRTPQILVSCVLILVLTLSCTATQKKAEKAVPVVKGQTRIMARSGLREIPLLQFEEPEKAPERVYSITMRDSDIRSVLMCFSKKSDYNITLDPDVTGTVTMDLKRVTLEEALDAILTPLGYVYRNEANIIKILKPKLETRIFTLNYLATVRTGTATVEAKTSGGVEKEAVGAAKVISEETADLWDDIQKGLKELLSENGKFIVNKMASIIVVTDYSDHLESVAEFLETVEGTVQRQVLIEARIMEVSLSDEYQMGLNWERILGGEHGTMTQASFAPTAEPGLGQTGVFQFAFNYSDVTGLLHTMAQQGEINIISKPRITTLNNQRAIIKVGTEEVYFEAETETSAVTTTIVYTPKFFTVGVVLDVTPQIGPGNELTLHIHPVISEKIDEKPYPASVGVEGGATIPIVSIRESSSVVKVESGQTLVLAGLLMEKTSETVTGVPGLMHIPLLGALFRYKNTEKTKTELVVALTPTILAGKGTDEFSDDELASIFVTDADRRP